MNAIGEKIRFIRAKKGLNQEQFSRVLGITRSYLSCLENGLKTPSASMETKINILFDEETKKDLAIGMRNKLVHQSVDSELKEQTIAKLNNLKEIPFERLIPTLEEMYAEEFTEEKKALFIGIYGLPINCIEKLSSISRQGTF